jgi:uncharacterized protein (TIRG00374 family)
VTTTSSRPVPESTSRGRSFIGLAAALGLGVAVVVVAGPQRVVDLVTTTRWEPLAAAFAAAVVAVALRGLRLALVLPPDALSIGRATLVVAAAQAAAAFVPARLGELALPWLLIRHADRTPAAGVGALLVVRALDLAGLAIWAAVALAVVGHDVSPAILGAAMFLALPPLLLPWSIRLMDKISLRWLAPYAGRRRRWAHRIRQLRREIQDQQRRPRRLASAFAVTIAIWGCLWFLTAMLLVAMGQTWPWWTVVAGSSAASAAGILPFTAVAGIGPLEAGWTAGFVALGVPLEIAAATGLTCHLWSLLFVAILGAAAWLALPSRNASTSRT